MSPALSISLFAALAAFPACAQGGVATQDEMERAKAALAEALKREQAGGGDQGPGQTDTAPSSASPAAATATPRVGRAQALVRSHRCPRAASRTRGEIEGACAGQIGGRGKEACSSPNACDPRKEATQNCECAQGDG